MISKAELRKELKQARLALTVEDRQAKSLSICQKLEQLDWSKIRTLHCFEPIEQLGEVDVTPLFNYLKIKQPQTLVYVTKLIDDHWQLVHLYNQHDTIPTQFDAIIIPMLGFDPKNLHRIGYGGSYYDKLLASQPAAQKIGVCFELGKFDKLPVEPHDISLNLIITESSVYKK